MNEIPIDHSQPVFVRAVQNGELYRVGSDETENLFDAEPAIAQRLTARLAAFVAENPPLDDGAQAVFFKKWEKMLLERDDKRIVEFGG